MANKGIRKLLGKPELKLSPSPLGIPAEERVLMGIADGDRGETGCFLKKAQ